MIPETLRERETNHMVDNDYLCPVTDDLKYQQDPEDFVFSQRRHTLTIREIKENAAIDAYIKAIEEGKPKAEAEKIFFLLIKQVNPC